MTEAVQREAHTPKPATAETRHWGSDWAVLLQTPDARRCAVQTPRNCTSLCAPWQTRRRTATGSRPLKGTSPARLPRPWAAEAIAEAPPPPPALPKVLRPSGGTGTPESDH